MTAPAAERVTAQWQVMLAKARRAMAGGREIMVPTGQVQPMPGQPRVYFDPESLARLAESMRTMGQIYPGIVRAIPAHGVKRYELLDGERRWRAAQLAKLDYRALLVTIDDESASFLIAAVANFNRESHTPTEIADAIEGMLGLGMPMAEIAGALGLSAAWAGQMHSLRRLAPNVRALLDPTIPQRHRLPTTAAIEIAKVAPALQHELAQRVLKKQVSLGELRGEAVAVSRAAGEPIRTRLVDPRLRFRSLAARSEQMRRFAQEWDTALAGTEGSAILDGRAEPSLQRLATNLRHAAQIATRLAERVEAATA